MNVIQFNNADNWQKQKDLAVYVISRLKSLSPLEVTTANYQSSLALAKLLQRFDNNREVKEIHVFCNFVRLCKNENGALKFSSVVIDHFERYIQLLNGVPRP